MSERVFKPQGLGFVMDLPAYRTTFTADRVRRSSGELHADLLIRTEWPGARVIEGGDGEPGIVHMSRMNLASAATRKTVGATVKARVPSPEGEELDWAGLVDEFCIRVMLAERAGVDVERVGLEPASIEPEWGVEPILPFASHGIVYGPGGLGKSAFMLAIGISVQTGKEVVEGFHPTITGPFIYGDWENSRKDISLRTQLMCDGAGIPRIEVLRRPGGGRTLADQVESFARLADTEGAVLLVVDSATKAIGTSGEGPIEDAANRFSHALDAIGRTTGVIDHIPKPRAGEKRLRGSGPIGSVMKTNWARASWEMVEAKASDELEEGETVHMALYQAKKNTTYRRRPIGIAMTWTRKAITFEREEVSDAALIEHMTVPERIAHLLASHPLTVKELAVELDTTENAVRAQLSRHKARFVNLGSEGWGLLASGMTS